MTKRKLTHCLFILVLYFFSLKVAAQSNADSIPAHETFKLESVLLAEQRTINIWTPVDYKSNADSLPVLYMLDGGIKEDFPHIANTIAGLIQAGKIKPIILVGIENTQRRRDLTGPTQVKRDKKIAPVVGKSDTFRSFIIEELIPEINKRYRTHSQKGIIGESLAGLFVMETFFNTSSVFDYYIAFDPSLWWNRKYLLRKAHKKLKAFPDTPKSLWFAASGQKEILKAASRLAELLQSKNKTGLKWEYLPSPGETHQTIFRATKEKALEWTFGQNR